MTNPTSHLLIIDDDVSLCELLSTYLKNEGFSVRFFNDSQQGADYLCQAHKIDIVILDIMMPGLSGLDVLRKIRPKTDVPVIMLTGRGDDIDRIIGLEMGADDYMGKPCNPRELVARIHAILRRTAKQNETAESSEHSIAQLHGIEIRPAELTAICQGENLNLTNAEFNTLRLLMQSPGITLSKASLTEGALHRQLQAYDRSIDVHVSRIRQKLAAHGVNNVIKSIRNAGYQLLPESNS